MKRISVLLFLMVFVFFLFPSFSFAGSNEYPFAVNIILPENNIGDEGYYHIPGEPGQSIVLQAELKNLSNKSIEIKAVALNAYSGIDAIFYKNPDEVTSDNYRLTDKTYGVAQYIADIEPINLKPDQSQTVDIHVTVPEIDAGTLLGGIRFEVFTGTQNMEPNNNNSSQFLIDKYLAITTAIQIDLPGKLQTSFTAGEPNFFEDSRNLGIKISNNAAILEENITGVYRIKDKQDAIIYEGSIKKFIMAPMTEFYYMIPWGDREFVQDVYTVYIDLNLNGSIVNYEIPLESVKQTTESENGSVSNDNGNTGNNNGVQTSSNSTTPQNSMRTLFVIGLAVVIIVFAILIYISYKRSKKTNRYRES